MYFGRKYMWILNGLIIRNTSGMLQIVGYFFQACSGHISNSVHLSFVGPLPHVKLDGHIHVLCVCRPYNVFHNHFCQSISDYFVFPFHFHFSHVMLIFTLLLQNSNLEAKGFGKPGRDFKSVRPLLCITAWYHHVCAPGFVFWLLKKIAKNFYVTSLCWLHLGFFSFRVKIEEMKGFFRIMES